MNDDYLYSWLETSWSFLSEGSEARQIAEDGENAFGDNTSIMGMILTISLLGVVLTILIKSFMKSSRI